MKTLSVLALVALIAGCHFDKLFSGGGGTPLSHDPPAGLAFTSGPGNARAGQPLGPVRVAVVDSGGTPVAGADSLVTIALGANPSGDATLTGTDTAHAVNGVAMFSDLSIDKPGSGYTLTATVAGLPSKESPSFDVMPPPSNTGDLTVRTNTTGASPDVDGYTVTVDDATSQAITTNSSGVTFTGLPVGSHKVELTGVAANCTVTAPNPRTVSVQAGATAQTSFAVNCPTPPPTTGSVRVTTSTTGASPDLDGYSVAVDNGTSQHIDPNNSTGVIFTDLPVGNHTAVLSGVAGNCTVTGGTSQTVNVTAGGTATAAFDISCPTPPPTTGSLAVTTTTSGASQDPDGYTVTVDGGGGASRSIRTNETITFNDLAPGSHTVVLSGIAGNCTVSGGPSQDVNITAGALARASFSVDCPTPPPPPNQQPVVIAGPSQNEITGLLVSLRGASFSDPDGDGPWSVTIDWGDRSTTGPFTMPSEGSINATHTYLVALLTDFHVTITVEDAHGARGSASKTITVALP